MWILLYSIHDKWYHRQPSNVVWLGDSAAQHETWEHTSVIYVGKIVTP